MLRTRDEILARLADLGIEARTYDHPAVFTVEESHQHTRHLPGAHCKNDALLDGDGLGEVARLIHVRAAREGDVVRDQLQGDDRQQRGQPVRRQAAAADAGHRQLVR